MRSPFRTHQHPGNSASFKFEPHNCACTCLGFCRSSVRRDPKRKRRDGTLLFLTQVWTTARWNPVGRKYGKHFRHAYGTGELQFCYLCVRLKGTIQTAALTHSGGRFNKQQSEQSQVIFKPAKEQRLGRCRAGSTQFYKLFAFSLRWNQLLHEAGSSLAIDQRRRHAIQRWRDGGLHRRVFQ